MALCLRRVWRLGLCLLLASCSLPGCAAPVIKVGLIAPFEGVGRPLGYTTLAAVRTALDEANRSGELGRYRVAVVAVNDDLDPNTAETQAGVLGQDRDILVVLGPWTAATAEAAVPTLTHFGIPVLVGAPLKALPTGARTLCPRPAEISAVAAGAVFPGSEVRYHAGDAEAAADDLLRWRASGWQGILVGGPDVARPWFTGRAGAAAEGTRALVCAAPDTQPLTTESKPAGADIAPEGDATIASASELAYAATRVLVRAIGESITAHGQPTRSGVAAALARQPVVPRVSWVAVRNGAWVRL